ncbi:MAG: hypothetical protein PHQ43_02415 [Dehalococcoidales bacterium]|nr:hypothetical protein [Dehalococcoidales bacterium]
MIETKHITTDDGEYQGYPQLHASVFGEGYPVNHPTLVVIVRDGGNVVGFVSGIWTELGRFYVQRTGIPTMFRGERKSFDYWNALEDHLRSLGAYCLSGSVEAHNTPTLIVALKTGWLINGAQYEDGCLYVRIGKELQNG